MPIALDEIQIRPATADDATGLAQFGARSFMDTFGHLYPERDAATFLAQRFSHQRTLSDIAAQDQTLELAILNGEIIGFCHHGPLGLPVAQPADAAYELYRLYLDTCVHGIGLADVFMARTIAHAQHLGATHLYLGVYHANDRALRFYRRHGFDIIGRYYFPVGDTLDDERIMVRVL